MGLIAQELETILSKHGLESLGVLQKDENGFYSVRYNDLIVPLIKAIQELSLKVEEQTDLLKIQNQKFTKITERLEALEKYNVE